MSTEITELMKELKLKYAVQTYKELSEDSALSASLTLDDALMTLLTAEVEGRRTSREIMLMRMSGIPVHAEMKDISYDENRGPEFAKIMARIKAGMWLGSGGNICILGSSGSGKTFIASAIARDVIHRGHQVMFANARDLSSSLTEKRKESEKAYKTARNRIKKVRLLVLDDFCLSIPDTDSIQSLFDIMNDRTGKNSTIVTSQKDYDRWVEEMGISAIGEAVAERIVENSLTVLLGEGSRRKRAEETVK